MKFTTRLVPIAFFLLAVQISLSHQKSQNFGQACSSSERCDSRKGTVSCNLDSLRCDCRDPATMEYDEKSGECVSIAGASCFVRPLRNRSVRNCVAGAVCSPVSSKSLFGTCVAVEPKSDNDENDMDLFADASSSTPADNESTPEDNGSSTPADNGSTPADNGSTPADNESTPADNGSTPADNGSTPADNGSTPADNGSTPADNGSTPADNGSTSADNGSTPADNGSTPADNGSTAADNGSTPEDNWSTPEPEKLPIGEECTLDAECIEHAVCPEGEKRTCQCDKDFLAQSGGARCARGIGGECTVEGDCLDNAHCMEQEGPDTCMCNKDFGDKGGLCAPYIDQACEKDDECFAEHSICELQTDTNSTLCKCSDSYEVNDAKDKCNSAITNVINFTLFVLLVSSTYIVNKVNH